MVSADIIVQALGSHNGFAHILDLTGKRIKTFKPHTASVVDMCFDSTADFIGTASMDGKNLSPTSFSPSHCLN
jgi:WD40 repeat protein